MAGTILTYPAFVDADATVNIVLPGNGGHESATFWVQIDAITRTTGTLDVSLRLSTDKGVTGAMVIASVAGIIATGRYHLPFNSPYDAAISAIPEPSLLRLVLNGDTLNVTGSIIAVYGD